MIKIKGIIAFLLAVANVAVMAFPFFSIVLLKLLIPFVKFKQFCTTILMPVARRYNLNNVAIFSMMGNIHWQIDGLANVNRKGSYLVIANHQSWADIVVLQAAVEARTPFLKFFLKKELMWVPVLGAAWWALDYPFMKRHSKEYLMKHPEKRGEDFAETRRMCEKFKHAPVAVMNFIEGTRYTPQKSKAQNSPYKHLLRPKVGGAALVINSMGRSVDTVLDVTIDYDVKGPASIWKLYTGQVKSIHVVCEEIKIPEHFFEASYENDPEFRKEIQAWFKEIWERKDKRLAHQDASEPARIPEDLAS